MTPAHLPALLLLALLTTDSPSRLDRSRAAAAPSHIHCPPGSFADERRSDNLLARLRSEASSKGILARLGRRLTVCYGDVHEGVLVGRDVIVLERGRSRLDNAARLAHLVLHVVDGAPFDDEAARASKRSCAELAMLADAAERKAHALENQLRRAFGLDPIPFEDLSADYQRRCEALRRKPA